MAPKGREPLRPSLPANLLKQIGGDSAQGPARSRHGGFTSRKDRRREERVQKRKRNAPLRTVVKKSYGRRDEDDDLSDDEPARQKSAKVKGSPEKTPKGRDDDDFGGFSDDADESESEEPSVSRAAKEKVSKEDAEIAALEKKLGIKKSKKLPKAFDEDGLGDLLDDLGGDEDDDDGELGGKRKRKAEADEWLAQKRRKAVAQAAGDGTAGDGQAARDGDDSSDEDLAGLDDSDQEPTQKRENPYVAPSTTRPVQKYIPPARRQETGSDAELLSRIRRQTQGLINRLTESNLLAILGDVERLYREYPRQHVTFTMVDLVLTQVCEPTSLPDTLLILHAGFATAVYKTVGPDFGAQLIQQTVERFSQHHAQASQETAQNAPKHTSNLITFMSQMYNFQLIGCNLIFDYVRFLLSDLSELNAELLLRVVRMAGQLLRHDDPLALKDIVALIRPAVQKVGEANLSVRTKFMIETINDLKNNKVKTGASASAVVQDHTTRIKKLLGSLNTRKLKATEPLRIGLGDIADSDKRGKWWLVGASWAGREGGHVGGHVGERAGEHAGDQRRKDASDSDEDEPLPDLAALAREQNMNTDVRRSIFIAIMSASDYEDAFARVMKLRLNKDRQKEVAHVVMQCAGAEQQYNPYYTLIAKRSCADRRIRFAFQDSLWKFFRRLGESTFGEDADEDGDEDDAADTRRIFSLGKMFGSLVASDALGLSVLKCLNLPYLRPKTQDFVEVMLITLFLEMPRTGSSAAKIFGAVADLPELSKGLQYFLRKRVRRSDLVGSKKDAKKVARGCKAAVEALAVPDLAEGADEPVAM